MARVLHPAGTGKAAFVRGRTGRALIGPAGSDDIVGKNSHNYFFNAISLKQN
jgi:hypothetical protein